LLPHRHHWTLLPSFIPVIGQSASVLEMLKPFLSFCPASGEVPHAFRCNTTSLFSFPPQTAPFVFCAESGRLPIAKAPAPGRASPAIFVECFLSQIAFFFCSSRCFLTWRNRLPSPFFFSLFMCEVFAAAGRAPCRTYRLALPKTALPFFFEPTWPYSSFIRQSSTSLPSSFSQIVNPFRRKYQTSPPVEWPHVCR